MDGTFDDIKQRLHACKSSHRTTTSHPVLHSRAVMRQACLHGLVQHLLAEQLLHDGVY